MAHGTIRTSSPGIIALLVALAAAVAACDDEQKPEGFHDRCEVDSGTCDAPYRCVPVKLSKDDAEPLPICTIPCEQNDDCPRWVEDEGHCKGPVQAQCNYGYCQAWCI